MNNNSESIKKLINNPVSVEEMSQESGHYIIGAYDAAIKYLRAPKIYQLALVDLDYPEQIEFGLRLLKPYKLVMGNAINSTAPAMYPDIDDEQIVVYGIITNEMTHRGAALVRR